MDAHMCLCGATTESRTHIVGECKYTRRNGFGVEEEMRKLDECDMEEFGMLESSDQTIAILGDRWRPQTGK